MRLGVLLGALLLSLEPRGAGSQGVYYIGAKNRLPPRTYSFKVAKMRPVKGEKYSNLMIGACKKLGMKPVCDHANYCRLDYRSLYIGQTSHLSFVGPLKGAIQWENLHNCVATANGGIRSTGGSWTTSFAYSRVEKTEADVSVTWRFMPRGEAMMGFDCGGDARSIYKVDSCHYFIVRSTTLDSPPGHPRLLLRVLLPAHLGSARLPPALRSTSTSATNGTSSSRAPASTTSPPKSA